MTVACRPGLRPVPPHLTAIPIQQSDSMSTKNSRSRARAVPLTDAPHTLQFRTYTPDERACFMTIYDKPLPTLDLQRVRELNRRHRRLTALADRLVGRSARA